MKPRSKQFIMLYLILSEATFNPSSTAQKMKFFVKDFFIFIAVKGAMFSVCSSRKTASNCLAQQLTA